MILIHIKKSLRKFSSAVVIAMLLKNYFSLFYTFQNMSGNKYYIKIIFSYNFIF